MSESLTFIRDREREGVEREYIVNVQCSVECILLSLYLMLVMSYCA